MSAIAKAANAMISKYKKKAGQKLGTRISGNDRAAGMNWSEQTGKSAGEGATMMRKGRLAKNKKRAKIGGAVAGVGLVGAAIAGSEDIDTKAKAEAWFEKHAPDASPAQRKKFASKHFGVEY